MKKTPKKNHAAHQALDLQLSEIQGDLPKARENLTLDERRDLLIRAGGPRTVKSILKAKATLPLKRIPWLFSSLDSQLVVDILFNDMQTLLSELGED